LAPDDDQAPLGRAIAWALVMGAAITTARMIAIRYTSKMLHGEQQTMTESAGQTLADNPVAGDLGRPAQVSAGNKVRRQGQAVTMSATKGKLAPMLIRRWRQATCSLGPSN
jgi:hypothetical protein